MDKLSKILCMFLHRVTILICQSLQSMSRVTIFKKRINSQFLNATISICQINCS